MITCNDNEFCALLYHVGGWTRMILKHWKGFYLTHPSVLYAANLPVSAVLDARTSGTADGELARA